MSSDDFTWIGKSEFKGLEFSVQFLDLSGTIFNNESIPDLTPSLNTIDFAFFDIEQWENGMSVFKSGGTLANNYSTVPIPAAVWLFGSGLISLMGMARKKPWFNILNSSLQQDEVRIKLNKSDIKPDNVTVGGSKIL